MIYNFNYKCDLGDFGDYNILFSLDDLCDRSDLGRDFDGSYWVKFSYKLNSPHNKYSTDEEYSIFLMISEIFDLNSKLEDICKYPSLYIGVDVFTNETLGELISSMILCVYDYYIKSVITCHNRFDAYKIFYVFPCGIFSCLCNTLYNDREDEEGTLLDWVEFYHKNNKTNLNNLKENLTFLGFEESEVR